MELRDEIADFLAREGISQRVLAERAGVHQSTVSRALNREPRRRTTAYARLCSYMQLHATSRPADSLGDAVRETWDGSEEHAAALAKLILASRELWPTLGKETAR